MAGAFWTIDRIREELEVLTKTAPYRPADFYKDFTRRLKEMFSDFKVLKGDDTVRTVDIIYANPERAIAKIREGKNTTLPILSLQFEDLELDSARRKPAEALVEKRFWDSNIQRAIRYMALAPAASNLSFAVNIWGKYVDEVNQLTEQLMLLFRPNLNIEIRPGEAYQGYLLDVSDASNLTAGDREDRIVKRTVRFQVQSYIPGYVFRFTNTSEIKTMNYEEYIEETNGLQSLESFYAGGGLAFALNQVSNRGLAITTIPGS